MPTQTEVTLEELFNFQVQPELILQRFPHTDKPIGPTSALGLVRHTPSETALGVKSGC